MDISFAERLSKIQGWAEILVEQLITGPRLVSYFGIFIISLIMGTLAGISFGKKEAASQNAIIKHIRDPMASISTIQQNILVIGVDNLENENPRLQSVWLLLFLPGNHHINFVSIYPSSQHNRLIDPDLIEQIFRIEPDGTPGSLVLNLLRANGIWWSYYALIDEIGMTRIINMFGGLQLNGYHLTGSLAMEALPEPWVDQNTAIRVQTSLLAGICKQARYTSKDTDFGPILEIIPAHIQTDLDTKSIKRDWLEFMINSERLVCEFPLLGTTNP